MSHATSTLFGHLATKFGTQTENLATEALSYILNGSLVVKQALLHFVAQAVEPLRRETLIFQPQLAGADGAIPDLVGLDPLRRQVLVIEAKFWAGLTDNQPLAYLNRLPDDQPGLLLFVVPGQRVSLLWPELLKRCAAGGHALTNHRSLGVEFEAVDLGSMQTLGLVSWRALLGALAQAVEQGGQQNTLSDLRQLQGLCARMDDEAFLPFGAEELTGMQGTRLMQLCQLVEDTVATGVKERLFNVSGLRSAGGFGWYGRYLRIQRQMALVHVSAHNWARLRPTPLWLGLYTEKLGYDARARAALMSLEAETPPRVLVHSDEVLVPLEVLTNAEKPQVVAHLLAQLRDVAALLAAAE